MYTTVNPYIPFASELYGKLLPYDQFFVSPVSIHTALTMTTVGARGETRSELEQVLGLSGLGDQEIVNFLLDQKVPTKVILRLANRLYAQEGANYKQSFLQLMAQIAGLERVNFADPAVVGKINKWVAEQTENMITSIISELDPLTVLALLNAIYFKGDWKYKFPKVNTREAPFYGLNGKSTVNMMYQVSDFNYVKGLGFQALELPYAGDNMSMLVFLPDDTDTLPQVESLVMANLVNILDGLTFEEDVQVYLPRFTMEWGPFSINSVLSALGIQKAFDSDFADFTGMTEEFQLWISNVLHKAVLRVDEDGSEAAAVTAVMMKREMAMITRQPIVFRVNRPFFFLIMDMEKLRPHFMGRVLNPEK